MNNNTSNQTSFISRNKISMIITAVILIIGVVAYFLSGTASVSSNMNAGSSAVVIKVLSDENLALKAAYTPAGDLKIFAKASNNMLKDLKVSSGISIPETDMIVIGNKEATMMLNENLFSKVGDKIDGLFGINVTIGGILKETDSLVDDLHFVSDHNFQNIVGEENRVFIKVSDGDAELVYVRPVNETTPLRIELAEGSMKNYMVSALAGVNYYPLILGADDAADMRESKEFSKVGDIIRDFLGRDVVIVGVLNKTNTALDMAHIVPFVPNEE